MGAEKECMLACAKMLEKYDNMVRQMSIYGNAKRLQDADLKVWQQEYFPKLVKSGLVEDYTFFGDTQNLGIGDDGNFDKSEYCHFMYRLYKAIAEDIQDKNYMISYIRQCIRLFEPYVEAFRRKVYDDKTQHLDADGMWLWKSDFQLYLCDSGLIEDGDYFVEQGRCGVSDGYFVGAELFHFLYRLNQYIVNMPDDLPTWKTLVFHCTNTVGGKITSVALSEDDYYVHLHADRFAKFMYAYSGGKVLFDVNVVTVDRSVTLSQYIESTYWLDCLDIKQEINQYAPDKTVDIIFGVSRYGKIPVARWGGLTTGIHSYANYAGYCITRFFDDIAGKLYLEPTLDNPPQYVPYPEEFMVHEAIHVLDMLYTEHYDKVPNPDCANDYGYSSLNPGGMCGYYKYYADILSCKVKDSTGQFIGVKADMWKIKPSNV